MYGWTRIRSTAGGSSSSRAESRSERSSRAKSMSVSRLKCTSMSDVPVPWISLETEMTFSTPLTCWTTASMGEVRKASTVSGEAPRQCASTLSLGRSVSGSSSMGMLRQALAPMSATARQPIATATGRRMLPPITGPPPPPGTAPHRPGRSCGRRSRENLRRPGGAAARGLSVATGRGRSPPRSTPPARR